MQAPGLLQRQTGALALTPRLQQSIALLQRSNQETLAWLLQEAQANPLIEIDATGSVAVDPATAPDGTADTMADWLADAPVDTLHHDEDSGGIIPAEPGTGDTGGDIERARAPGLIERLEAQLRLAALGPVGRMIGTALLGMLDDAGRLDGTPEDLAAALGVTRAEVEAVRAVMMLFDPPGCFARNLAECLAAQLRARNRLDPAMQTLIDHLDILARGDMPRLRRLCGVDAEDFAEMIAELRALDPKPGFDPENAGTPAIPDVFVRRHRGGWVVVLNEETLPRLRLDRALGERLGRGDADSRAYGKAQHSHAAWLMGALAQRSKSILAVTRAIVARQDAFLERGASALRPLALRQIAEATSLHESTVSRITTSRYIGTPRGVLPLRSFFSVGLGTDDAAGEGHSAEAIRQRIRTLVEGETPAAVLSDDAITATLQAEGVTIMRRTVAKYREALGIANSAQRRRQKRAP